MKKLTVSTVITFIFALWEMISPTAQVVFGIGTKGMTIIAMILTIISFAYDYFYPNESLLRTVYRTIFTGGELPTDDDEEGGAV